MRVNQSRKQKPLTKTAKMTKKIETVELTATVKDSRKKAVRLTLTVNNETLTLWFRRLDAKATDETETTWNIKKPALDKAIEEAHEFNAYRNSTYSFSAGSFGVCKNGSYYFKTRGWNYAVERPVNCQLAFIRAEFVTVNEDGTVSVNAYEADKALNDAIFRTDHCDEAHFTGIINA